MAFSDATAFLFGASGSVFLHDWKQQSRCWSSRFSVLSVPHPLHNLKVVLRQLPNRSRRTLFAPRSDRAGCNQDKINPRQKAPYTHGKKQVPPAAGILRRWSAAFSADAWQSNTDDCAFTKTSHNLNRPAVEGTPGNAIVLPSQNPQPVCPVDPLAAEDDHERKTECGS